MNRRLSVNGKAVPTTIDRTAGAFVYATELIDGHPAHIELIPTQPAKDYSIKVPPGNYVVFGDSRDNSQDSRHFGTVPQKNLAGKVVKIFPPRDTTNRAN